VNAPTAVRRASASSPLAHSQSLPFFLSPPVSTPPADVLLELHLDEAKLLLDLVAQYAPEDGAVVIGVLVELRVVLDGRRVVQNKVAQAVLQEGVDRAWGRAKSSR